MKRRFIRILIPFIFWALIFPICLAIINKKDIFSVVELFLSNQYWFVWMLIGAHLFLPVINSFIKEYKIKGVEYFLVIWLFTIILNTFGLYPFHNLELSYFAAYIGFIVLGYYLTNKEFKIKKNHMVWIGMLLFIVFTIINIMYYINK